MKAFPKNTNKTKSFLVFFQTIVTFQAIAFFFSFPFLFHKGFSISPLALVGNFIFVPFLFIFMGTSIFIFFFELIGINNFFLVYILEIITDFWLWLLQSLNLQTCFHVNYFKLKIFLIICFLGICLSFFKKTSTQNALNTVFVGFLILQVFSNQLLKLQDFPQQIKFKTEIIKILGFSKSGKLVLQSSSFLRKNSKKSYWVNFEFNTWLAKNFGTTNFVIQKLK